MQRSLYDPGLRQCHVALSTGASSAASWSGGSGSTSRRTGRSPAARPFSPSRFRNRDVPHIIFFFNLAIVWVMLWIEARRYRFYDAFRARVRMLEAHFLVPMVTENRELLQGEWQKLVCEDLILPCFKISKLEAIGRRLKRNYVFHFHPHHGRVDHENFPACADGHERIDSFYQALRVGHIPAWLVALFLRRHFGQRHRHHGLREQENLGRDLRVRYPSFALADLSRLTLREPEWYASIQFCRIRI